MKVLYDFDCHCCVEDIELYVSDDATDEEIELAVLRNIVSLYANHLGWKKAGEHHDA